MEIFYVDFNQRMDGFLFYIYIWIFTPTVLYRTFFQNLNIFCIHNGKSPFYLFKLKSYCDYRTFFDERSNYKDIKVNPKTRQSTSLEKVEDSFYPLLESSKGHGRGHVYPWVVVLCSLLKKLSWGSLRHWAPSNVSSPDSRIWDSQTLAFWFSEVSILNGMYPQVNLIVTFLGENAF